MAGEFEKWTKTVGDQLIELTRQVKQLEARQAPARGCICPPDAEAGCKGDMCPRRSLFANVSKS